MDWTISYVKWVNLKGWVSYKQNKGQEEVCTGKLLTTLLKSWIQWLGYSSSSVI